MSEKLRRLRVYEKGGSLVFKKFLFISQLVDLALQLMSRQHCSRVCFIINAPSRQKKNSCRDTILETNPVNCVATQKNMLRHFL